MKKKVKTKIDCFLKINKIGNNTTQVESVDSIRSVNHEDVFEPDLCCLCSENKR